MPIATVDNMVREMRISPPVNQMFCIGEVQKSLTISEKTPHE